MSLIIHARSTSRICFALRAALKLKDLNDKRDYLLLHHKIIKALALKHFPLIDDTQKIKFHTPAWYAN